MYHLYRRTCGWILRYAYRTLWREYVDWGCSSGPGCIYGNVWCGSNFQGIFVIIREKKIEFAKGGGKYVVVYWWWNHNLCVRYVYLLKAGLNMEINRKMEILLCRWSIWVLLENNKNRWYSICLIWNYYDYASGYFGVINLCFQNWQKYNQFVKVLFYELVVFLVSFANWKLSLYFCCILAKILSITSVTVIKAPTRV